MGGSATTNRVIVPRALTLVLVAHAVLAAIPRIARNFVVWDAYTPTSQAAFAVMNTVRPLVWPLTGVMVLSVAIAIVVAMIRQRTPRLAVRPADAAAAILLVAFVVLALMMRMASPQMPMVRITGNPLIHSPVIAAYILLWRNDLGGLTSGIKERTAVALVGLQSGLLLASATLQMLF